MNTPMQAPTPEKLVAKSLKTEARTLRTSVAFYVHRLWEKHLRQWFGSVGNKDAITGNRMFDRHRAVDVIRAAAKEDKDSVVTDALDGLIYKHMVSILREKYGFSLKHRRELYKALSQPAE